MYRFPKTQNFWICGYLSVYKKYMYLKEHSVSTKVNNSKEVHVPYKKLVEILIINVFLI